jgi:chemotaxis protein MotB
MSKKHKRAHEEENHERWLVSYADFITLLFAFFVVMYATSNNDEKKQKSFEDSVRVELKLGVGGGSSSNSGQDLKVSREAILAETGVKQSDLFPKRGSPEEIRDYLERQVGGKVAASPGVSVRHDSVGARIVLSAASFFPSGSSQILRESFPALDRIAEILKQTDRRILIEGHTDDVPFQSAGMPSNWELASLRATGVLRYFVKVHGIDPRRLAAISYADQKPIAPNDTDENRSKNRRVEILVLDNSQ